MQGVGWVVRRNGDECNCRSWAAPFFVHYRDFLKTGAICTILEFKENAQNVFKLPGRRLFCLIFVVLASQPIIGMYIEQSIILRARVFDGSGFVALAVDLKLGQ